MGWFSSPSCPNHPDREATGFCRVCRQKFCSECLEIVGDYQYCTSSGCQKRIGAKDQEYHRDTELRKYGAELRKNGKDEAAQGLIASLLEAGFGTIFGRPSFVSAVFLGLLDLFFRPGNTTNGNYREKAAKRRQRGKRNPAEPNRSR